MCKLCDMANTSFGKDKIDIKYAESNNWICVGDKETGNPYIIYKSHYNDGINEEIKNEGKMMINLLTTKYWNKMKLNIEGKSYPHTYLILSEVK